MISLADLDQDGDVEVITRAAVLDGVTGRIELEVVSARRIYGIEGDRLVIRADNGVQGDHPLVDQLDGEGNNVGTLDRLCGLL